MDKGDVAFKCNFATVKKVRRAVFHPQDLFGSALVSSLVCLCAFLLCAE